MASSIDFPSVNSSIIKEEKPSSEKSTPSLPKKICAHRLNEVYFHPKENAEAHIKKAKCWNIAAIVTTVALSVIVLSCVVTAFLTIEPLSFAVITILSGKLVGLFIGVPIISKMKTNASLHEMQANYEMKVQKKMEHLKKHKSQFQNLVKEFPSSLKESDPRLLALISHYLIHEEEMFNDVEKYNKSRKNHKDKALRIKAHIVNHVVHKFKALLFYLRIRDISKGITYSQLNEYFSNPESEDFISSKDTIINIMKLTIPQLAERIIKGLDSKNA